MAAHYQRIPLKEPAEHVELDFSSPFTYSAPLKQSMTKYSSMFTYGHDGRGISVAHMTMGTQAEEQSFAAKCCQILLITFCYLLLFVTFPISWWFVMKSVPQYERLVVFRLGRLQTPKGPGMVVLMPCLDKYHRVDMRMRAFNVPPQQVITLDHGIVEVGADVYFRISAVEKSITCVQNLNIATRTLVQTTMVRQLAAKSLAAIEAEKNLIAQSVQDECNTASFEWGVEISRIEIPQIKVLQTPKASSISDAMFPPGLAINPALQQLTSAVISASKGQNQGHPNQDLETVFQGLNIGMPTGTLPSQVPATSDLTNMTPDHVSIPMLQPVVSNAASNDPSSFMHFQASQCVTPAHHKLPTPQELMEEFNFIADKGLVRQIGAVYQFDLDPDNDINGGSVETYYLDLKNGSGCAGVGAPPTGKADVTLCLSISTMQALFAGNLSPLQAYTMGKLKITGSLSIAMKLEDIFSKLPWK